MNPYGGGREYLVIFKGEIRHLRWCAMGGVKSYRSGEKRSKKNRKTPGGWRKGENKKDGKGTLLRTGDSLLCKNNGSIN